MLRSAWDALRAHPRAAWGLLAFVLLVLAFAAGRASAPPPRVEVRTVEVVKWREREVVRREVQREAAQVREVVRWRERVVRPDGTRHEREVEASASASVTVLRGALTRERTVEGEARREVRVAPAAAPPTWRVGVLAGVSPGAPLSPSVGPLLERRLVGPVSLGAWALVPTRPGAPVAGGLALSVAW